MGLLEMSADLKSPKLQLFHGDNLSLISHILYSCTFRTLDAKFLGALSSVPVLVNLLRALTSECEIFELGAKEKTN